MSRFEIRRSKLGRRRWRVLLRAENGEVLMVSEHLNSRHACNVNIAAVISDARHADIVDLTQESTPS